MRTATKFRTAIAFQFVPGIAGARLAKFIRLQT